MSFFASGGWRSSTIAHATTKTNPVLTSGQVSISESMSGDATERRPLSGALKGSLVGISGRNGSQVSISNPDPNPSGKKLTFRGVARALYFIGSTISANAPSPPAQHETAVHSSSPHAAGTLVPPMDRSTLSQEVDEKRSAWRGVPKILPSLLKSSREVSISTAPQDHEPAESIKHSPSLGSKIPVRRMTASPKASLLPESRHTPPLKGRGKVMCLGKDLAKHFILAVLKDIIITGHLKISDSAGTYEFGKQQDNCEGVCLTIVDEDFWLCVFL